MFLKSVELFGFKSFPDRTRMNFEKGVTVIVGPNGCGKSNISDAIRWVFGERSTKALRSKKMEDVIFSGTPDRAASSFAEVSLFLDNTDRGLDLDEDEVCVTRRIYRTGDTEYLINKKTVRLADLLEVFMDTGLGVDGYSLIGQGRIAEIVSARSEERREIFEEAAGISKHRWRREDAERNLERASENLLRINDIKDELESRLQPLAAAAEKAKQYLAMAAEREGLELGVWLYTLTKNRGAVEQLGGKIDALQAGCAEDEIRLSRVQTDSERHGTASQAAEADLDRKRRGLDGLREKAAGLQSALELAGANAAHRQSDIERIAAEAEQHRRAAADCDVTVTESRTRTAAVEELCRTLEGETAGLEAELAQLNERAGGMEKQAADLYAAIGTLSESVNNARLLRVQTEARNTELGSRITEGDAALSEQKARLSELVEESEYLKQDYEQASADLQKAENSRQGLLLKLDTLRRRAAADSERISELRVSAEGCRHRARTLSDMEKQMEGYGGSVKAVLQQGERGGLRGIRGTVSRLLTVPDEYAVAVEVALGGALQHIVTADEEDAKYAINFLKSRDLGRATFLPITAVRGDVASDREFDGCAGYRGNAARLVQYDAEYQGIFARLLGRTAICEDLDRAVAAAKKTGYKYRIVTLDGQVVNAGGSMTGGSLNKNSGVLSRSNQIRSETEAAERFEKELAERQAAAEKLNAEITAAQSEADSYEENLAGLRDERLRTELSISQAGRESERLTEQSGVLAKLLVEMKTELSQNQTALASSAGALAADTALLAQKNAESQTLSEGRSEFFGQRETLLGKIADKKLEIAAKRSDISVIGRGIELALAEKENRLRAAADCETAKARTADLDEADAGEAERIRSDIEAVKGDVAATENDIAELIALRDGHDKTVAELRETEREISARRQQAAGDLARLQERRSAAQREYDDTVARMWDEYEYTPSDAAKKAAPIENPAEAAKSLNRLRDRMRGLGSVNPDAEREYAEVRERYDGYAKQVEDIEKSNAELRRFIASLNQTMTEMFTRSFNAINEQFQEVFVQLFGGGKAELCLADPDNVLECGIDIKPQLPGKSVRLLEQLSGGEQAFLAVAIYFAILKVKPTPFCLLDEIEAALDDINIQRFAEYLQTMSADTQFIAITHRRGTMEIADTLYGVTMRQQGASSGVSRILKLDIGEVESKLGIKI